MKNRCVYCKKETEQKITVAEKELSVCGSAFCLDAAGVEDYSFRIKKD